MPRIWTDPQKAAKRAEQQAYWKTHSHPRRGARHSGDTIAQMKKPKSRRPIIGHCNLCNRPLYDPESVKRGMGPTCSGLHS